MEIQGRATIKESFTPISLFLAGILAFGMFTGLLSRAYFQRFPDAPAPVVSAPVRKMVDECGVYMWVQWDVPRDPTVDGEEPFVSMADRIKQRNTRGQRSIP